MRTAVHRREQNQTCVRTLRQQVSHQTPELRSNGDRLRNLPSRAVLSLQVSKAHLRPREYHEVVAEVDHRIGSVDLRPCEVCARG